MYKRQVLPCSFRKLDDKSGYISPKRDVKSRMDLRIFWGSKCGILCSVVEYDGILDAEQAGKIIAGKEKKVLWKGSVVFTEDAARVFAEAGMELTGVESLTVGPEDSPAGVHKILLGAGMAILEGLYLCDVECDEYFLCAQPLKLGGCDGAPCRAVLIEGI